MRFHCKLAWFIGALAYSMPMSAILWSAEPGTNAAAVEAKGIGTISSQTPGPQAKSILGPTVHVRRKGRALQLDCETRGVSGGRVVSRDRKLLPPRFTIYRGEEELASDDFQFG